MTTFNHLVEKPTLRSLIRETEVYKNAMRCIKNGFSKPRATSTPKGYIKVYFKFKKDCRSRCIRMHNMNTDVIHVAKKVLAPIYVYNESSIRQYLDGFTNSTTYHSAPCGSRWGLPTHLRNITSDYFIEILREDSGGELDKLCDNIIQAALDMDSSDEKKNKVKKHVMGLQMKRVVAAVQEALKVGGTREEIVKCVDNTICEYIIDN